MGIRVKRRVVKRALVLLLFGTVLYIFMHSFYIDIEENAPEKLPKFVVNNVQRNTTDHPSFDQKRKRVSVQLPKVNVSELRGQAAMKNYCNSPSQKTTGNEGAYLEGYKLRLVHVFIRHGDRTSIHRFAGYKPEIYNCKFSTWYTGTNEKFLLYSQRMDEMSKGNGQIHFRNWPAYPNEDMCRDSVLTSRGALQLLQLGQHLYNSYINHFHLFKSHKTFSSQMGVKSTGTLRTYQSSVALLYGFVPEFNISDFYIGYSQDLHFCSKEYSMQQTCNCPRTKALRFQSFWFQSAMSTNGSKYKELGNFVANVFGIADNDLNFLTRVADALVPAYCHNLSIPCSTFDSSKCVDYALFGRIWDAITDKEFSNWNDPELNFLKYCSIKMAPVLSEVLERMKSLMEGNDTKIFNLYSGHDVTLSSLLYVLGLHDGRWPPYASRVVIEMYEEENEDKIDRFYLKFLYNGVDKTENVIFCRNGTTNGLCNFNLFSEFISSELLQRFGYSGYRDACHP